jgi:hypothetical protein
VLSHTKSGDFYEPSLNKPKYKHTPLDVKINVLNMVREHSYWSWHTLRKHGAGMLKQKEQLQAWREDVERGTRKLKQLINEHLIALLKQGKITCLLQPEQFSSRH